MIEVNVLGAIAWLNIPLLQFPALRSGNAVIDFFIATRWRRAPTPSTGVVNGPLP